MEQCGNNAVDIPVFFTMVKIQNNSLKLNIKSSQKSSQDFNIKPFNISAVAS